MSKRSRRLRFQRRTLPGSAPGIVQPHPNSPAPKIRVIAYGPDQFHEEEITDIRLLPDLAKRFAVTWIDIDALGDADIIMQLGTLFGLHPLALEDVANVHQRAKVEPYDDYLFIVTRMVSWQEHLDSEQMSLFLCKKVVLTFQERPGDCLDPLRERLRKNNGRLRKTGTDFLAYALIDAVIDSYFPVAERFSDELDALEDRVAGGRDASVIRQLHQIRNDLLLLRRAVRPHRDAVNELIRDEHPLIDKETRVFLRDCYDHTVQLIDLLEVYREMCGDLRDFYVSVVSNRLNEIMKVLTIIATIFIPLGFIASVYGMNFDTNQPGNMPELHWKYGYVFALGVMAAVAGGLLLFFRRKGWLGSVSEPKDNNQASRAP